MAEIKIKTDETTAQSIVNILEAYKSANKYSTIDYEVSEEKKKKKEVDE